MSMGGSTFQSSNASPNSTSREGITSGFVTAFTASARASDIGGGGWRNKRPSSSLEDAECEDDVDYDGGEESSASLVDEKMSLDGDISPVLISTSWTPNLFNKINLGEGGDANVMGGGNGASEKKAAWLLMNLSVKDGEFGGAGVVTSAKEEMEGPRVKRRRATSF